MKKVQMLLALITISFSVLANNGNHVDRKLKKTKTVKIPMKANHWEFEAGQVEFLTHQSMPAMNISSESAPVVLKDFSFSDGTIEYDVMPKEVGFTSLLFRRKNEEESEVFYLRTGRAGNPSAIDAVQYAPIVKGLNLWDLYGYYQGAALFQLNEWNHVKLVISGKRMLVYVNDLNRPALEIPRLEGNSMEGGLAFRGASYIANLTIKPNETEGLSPEMGFDPTHPDPNYIRNWAVSEPMLLPEGRELSNNDLPTAETQWNTIQAERRGLVNLSRHFGKSDSRRVVWLKVKLKAIEAQVHKVDFGFSDEVWVYLNNKLVYLDKNLYKHPIMKEPEGRCSLENTSFNLAVKAGENELLIGVANDFYGWGIIARLNDMEGVTIEN